MRIHAGQLEDYLRTTGADRGALVYMTVCLVVGGAQYPPGSEPVMSVKFTPLTKGDLCLLHCEWPLRADISR